MRYKFKFQVCFVSIEWFVWKLWPLEKENFVKMSVFHPFLETLKQINLIFGMYVDLLDELQIKFKFCFAWMLEWPFEIKNVVKI